MVSAPHSTTSERLDLIKDVTESAQEVASLFSKNGWPSAHSIELFTTIRTPLASGMLRSRGVVEVANKKSIGIFGKVLPGIYLNLDGHLIVQSGDGYTRMAVAGQPDSRLVAINTALRALKHAAP